MPKSSKSRGTAGAAGRERLTSGKSSWTQQRAVPSSPAAAPKPAAPSDHPGTSPAGATMRMTRRQLSIVTASSAGSNLRSSSLAGSAASASASASASPLAEYGRGAAVKDVDDDDDDKSVISISSSSSESAKKPAAKTPSKSAGKKRPAPHAATSSSSSSSSSHSDESSDEVEIIDTCNPEPRYPSRERKSTVMIINGHAVKRDNNYVVRGDTYVYGAFDATAECNASGAAKRKTAVAASGGSGISKPKKKKQRVLSQAEIKRAKHNETVKGRVAAKRDARRAFLASMVDVLDGFVEESVANSLRGYAKGNAGAVKEAVSAWRNTDMQPDLIKGDMRDYQMIGLNWMARMHSLNCGMILGDEMGLGKTLQTISLLCHLKESGEKVSGPSLVICPLSVLYSWCDELEKWAPGLNFLRFHSSCVKERESQRDKFKKAADTFDVVVTTYEMAKNPALASLWARQHFNILVLDEGHKIKNHESLIAKGVRHIHCENRLILTGTPLQNNLVELWSLLNFLCPDVFTVSEPFGEAFDIGKKVIDKEKLAGAHKLLECFMIRRMKVEVEKLMPFKIETRVICPLSTTQIYWYKALLMKDVNLLARVSEQADAAAQDGSGKQVFGGSARSQLSNLMMQLRKCCIHPFLFDGAEVDTEATSLEELIAASGKLAVLDKLLRSLFTKGHRVVLFSQFTSALDILDDYCYMRGWNYCRFDGSTPRARRNFTVTQFNAPASDTFIFLMSTRSGGMGLNLQTADTCVLFDSDWNPQPDIQAMARVHRIGQKKTVHVYRLVTGGTVEERMVERAQKKLYLDTMVNRGTSDGSSSSDKPEGLSASELLSSLKFGCNAVFGDASKNALPVDDDIEVITDRTRTGDTSAGNLRGGVTETAQDFDTEVEFKSTTKFGGVDFSVLRDEQREKKQNAGTVPSNLRDVAVQWAQVYVAEKRERKQRLLMVKGKGSGYGSAFVPVLASNNYDLDKGESSVFSRELGDRNLDYATEKINTGAISGRDFQSQDFCQKCGEHEDDSGMAMIKCQRCPVALHPRCAGAQHKNKFMWCSHHRCSLCHKDWTAAGGILFPCQSCPVSYCEDCLPKSGESTGVRLLVKCERFEKLGFESGKKFCYIHCSGKCEVRAEKKFGWSLAKRKKPTCPDVMDVSHNFGRAVDEAKLMEEEGKQGAGEGGRGKRRS